MTNFNLLRDKIRQQVDKYDSACDNIQRRMASRKLLKILEENHSVIEEIMPDFQKFYCELQYCCYQRPSEFMSKIMSSFTSNDIFEFVSEGIDDPISETMAEALSKSLAEAMSGFLPKVISKMIHHFCDEFDKATQ